MSNKRSYNVFFNTHTVSGIIISIALYICFLAGAFALFQTNINKWEANEKTTFDGVVNYEKALSTIKNEGYTMTGRTFFMQQINNPKPVIMVISRPVRAKKGTTSQQKTKNNNPVNGLISIKIDPTNYTIIDFKEAEPKEHLGTFLYDLHFFDQIPKIGIYLAGLVAIFLLFAIITGTIIHWKKIVSNFFTFRLKGSAKNLWTDAHTALGIIGLPFQFMYAVTGASFGLLILVLLPSTIVLFDGNQADLLGHFAPAYKSFEKTNELLIERPNINTLVQNARKELQIDATKMSAINLTNYNDANAHLMVEFRADNTKRFYDDTYIIYRLKDNKVVENKELITHSYKQQLLHTIRKLHFGQFGGYFVKIVYFLLSLITCFVILSGVMIWLKARNNKKYQKKKVFNTNVGAIYLGASLGLLPSIAFFFCIVKVVPLNIENRFSVVSNAFFLFWFGYIIYAFISKNYFNINKYALLLTGVFGVMIPFLNGLQSNLWFWKSFSLGYRDSFFVDVSWLIFALVSFIIFYLLKEKKDDTEVKTSKEKSKGGESKRVTRSAMLR